ncbi:MAG: AsmA-like C-terminal region-containing protein [Candidatus Tritonobacter lacicola]|nr:AsmA-like C-terminal region-containing protein [Candidatus Tritonobacter lacicola]
MKKKRRLILLIAGLIILLAAALETVSRVYLSNIALPIVRRELSSATGCQAEMDDVRFSIFGGIVIKDLHLKDAEGIPIFSSEEVRIRPWMLPLLLLRFEVRAAKLVHPVVTLRRDGDGRWNLARLVADLAKRKGEVGALPSHVKLREGRVEVQYSPGGGVEHAAEKFDMDLGFTTNGKASYRGSVLISVSESSSITVKGTYDPVARQNLVKAVGNGINLAPHAAFIREISGIPLAGTAGEVDFDIDVKAGADEVTGNGTVTWEGIRIDDKSVSFSGDLSMEGGFYTDMERAPIYRGTVKVSSSTLKLDVVPREFTGVAGLINVSGDMMSSTNLTGIYEGHPVRAMGNITGFSAPELDLKVDSTVEINRILELFGLPPDIADSKIFSGMSETEIFIRGKLTGKEPLLLTGGFKVSEGSVALKELPAIQDISGTAYIIADEVVIRNAQGRIGEESVSIKGDITMAAEPGLDITISSPESLISLKGTIVKDALRLESLSGNFGTSTFAISGLVRDFADPYLDLTYNGNANLDRLRKMIPEGSAPKPLFGIDLIPKGNVSLHGTIEGAAFQPEKLAFDLEGSSNSLELAKWFINSVSFSANMKDGFITVDNFTGIINQGTITANGTIDTSGEKIRISLAGSGQGINFKGKMPEDSKEQTYGTLTGDINVKGFPSDPSSLSGDGKILIERGKIWQLNFFKGLQNILGVVHPNIGSIVFDRISGTFSLENSFIDSTDLTLDSSSIKLYTKGRVGLDGTLDCVMDVQLFNTRGNLIKKVTGTIMNISGQLVGVKLTGTIKDPDWRPVMLPFFKEIEKTGRRGGRFLKKALPSKSE